MPFEGKKNKKKQNNKRLSYGIWLIKLVVLFLGFLGMLQYKSTMKLILKIKFIFSTEEIHATGGISTKCLLQYFKCVKYLAD